jgi:hypothetical protein
MLGALTEHVRCSPGGTSFVVPVCIVSVVLCKLWENTIKEEKQERIECLLAYATADRHHAEAHCPRPPVRTRRLVMCIAYLRQVFSFIYWQMVVFVLLQCNSGILM